MAQVLDEIEEPCYTAEELGIAKKLHPSTIRRRFFDEPGVIRYGRGRSRGRRQYYTLRIPRSVAQRVFGEMTVAPGAAKLLARMRSALGSDQERA